MSFLYNLIIQPLIMIYDVLFSMFYGMLENTVASIIALSIMINLLVLPLYRKADLMQKEQHEKALKMKKWVDHIRKTFHGDKCFMMLSAYYRIEGYNPLSTIKEAGPLLLQVPFFIAAYRYISNLTLLKGAYFGPIKNMLAPDRLISIAGITINVLPIIMTLINLVSGYIYSKNLLLRQKIQIYGLALVFLILLYNSPSGLVIYWIMNNLFSLCKNLYYQKLEKYKNYIKVFFSFALIVLIITEYSLLHIERKADIIVAEVILVYVIVNLIITALQIKQVNPLKSAKRLNSILAECDRKTMIARIILPELCLVMLLGVYIPTNVISSSPLEFINRNDGSFQSGLLIYPAIVYSGLFFIWTTVMVLSREGKKRQLMILGLWAALGVMLYNQFLAPAKTGELYSDMTFDGKLKFSASAVVVNLIICFLAAAVLIIILLKTRKLYKHIVIVICVTLFAISMVNVYRIGRELSQTTPVKNETQSVDTPITLSKTGKNVVVFMLDRAIGTYVPYIFDEKPELKESFKGFVYYPNTVSFGFKTNICSPALFGGYEYTPYEMNKRSNELLKDKHNEAIKMMPVLFMNEGYKVTVCDPPYANYQEIPDLSIYDEYPEISAYNLTGKYTGKLSHAIVGSVEDRQKHNFLFYGIFRTVPLFVRDVVYGNGRYFSIGIGSGAGYSSTMLDTYSVLWNLTDITSVYESDKGSFLMMQNSTTHNPTQLNPPDYAVDGSAFYSKMKYKDLIHEDRVMKIENSIQWGHYCINVASYQAVAKWLDYLKEEGVYDNTRIILVADHGYYLSQFPELVLPSGLDIESFNPLLMVKDFNSNNEISSDNTFMTIADVPMLATEGVINEPKNPFTGILINDSLKHKGPVIVTDSYNWQIKYNNGTTFDLKQGKWWLVHDNLFDRNNWALMDKEDAA